MSKLIELIDKLLIKTDYHSPDEVNDDLEKVKRGVLAYEEIIREQEAKIERLM